jgi:hypothetical protein
MIVMAIIASSVFCHPGRNEEQALGGGSALGNRGCRSARDWNRAVLDLLERRLVDPHAAVIIPAYDRIIVVSLLNCAEFSCWFSKVAQTFDAISGIQLLIGGGGLGERRPLGSV